MLKWDENDEKILIADEINERLQGWEGIGF